MSRKRSRWILAPSTAPVFPGGNRACLQYQALTGRFSRDFRKKGSGGRNTPMAARGVSNQPPELPSPGKECGTSCRSRLRASPEKGRGLGRFDSQRFARTLNTFPRLVRPGPRIHAARQFEADGKIAFPDAPAVNHPAVPSGPLGLSLLFAQGLLFESWTRETSTSPSLRFAFPIAHLT